jgi:hypothetical protein
MNQRLASRLAPLVVAGAFAAAYGAEREASACGGCFPGPQEAAQTLTDVTDEKMLLAVSPTQSTLYDEIEYSGSPSSFAWVLPIRGTVTVGLSADVLFQSIDTLTATQINPPPSSCPQPNCSGGGCASSSKSGSASFAGDTNGGNTVQVLKQSTVGPYDTVQLHSTDASALDGWLTQNGFDIPVAVQPILGAYVSEGFDFLAMKLSPGQGVQAMRPVRVTTAGAGLSLPLRMASIGTGAITGITIWIVADGRYEPHNFQTFYIPTSSLVWDWSSSSSNYTTLRAAQEASFHNAAWELESSFDLSVNVITNVILAGGQYTGYSAGPPGEAAQDYLPVGNPSEAGVCDDGGERDEGDDGGASDGGTGGGAAGDAGLAGDGGGASQGGAGGGCQTAEQVRAADIATLFAGMTSPTIRVTRIRSDIAQTAMMADLQLQASADQSEVSNIRQVTQSINEKCPLYDGCNQVGTGTVAQAQASVNGGCSASLPGRAGTGVGFGAGAGALLLLARRSARRRRSG